MTWLPMWPAGQRKPSRLEVGGTLVQVDKMIANLGDLGASTSNITSFCIKNVGSQPVLIDGNVRTTCKCTVAGLQSDVKLEAGAEQEIDVSLMTGTSVAFRQPVLVRLTDLSGQHPRFLTLTIIGSRLPSVRIIPDSLDFGGVRKGHEVVRTVRVSETIADVFEITAVDVPRSAFEHSIRTQKRADGRRDYLIDISLTSTTLEKGDLGEVSIGTTSARNALIRVPYRAWRDGAVQVIPSGAAFGTLAIGDSREVELEVVAAERLRLVSVSAVEQVGSVRCTSFSRGTEPKSSGRVKLVFSAASIGVCSEDIRLRVDLVDELGTPQTDEIVVKCVAEVVGLSNAS